MRIVATDSGTQRVLAVDDAGDLWTRVPGEEWQSVETATLRRVTSMGAQVTQVVVALPERPRLRAV